MSEYLEGNRVTLLKCGLEYFPALEAAIDGASCEVHLETYIFEDDSAGRRIASALTRAVSRGVQVKLLVDGFGGRGFVARLQSLLEKAGVSVLIYRREIKALSLRKHRLRRLHRKVSVIDARIAFVGGINIIDDFSVHELAHPRYDYAVRIEGPLVGQIVPDVRRLWWLVSWASLRRRQSTLAGVEVDVSACGPVRAAFVVRDNLAHRNDIEAAYLAAIRGAKSEVLIACAYFLPGRRFRQALTQAAQRGVQVQLLLQGLSDQPVLAYATRSLYPYLLAQGVILHEYRRSILHAKVAVVDGEWATVGSSNIDPFSLLLAREANVLIDDKNFAKELQASLHEAISVGACQLHTEDIRRLPVLRRLVSWAAYQLVRLAIGLAGFGGRH